MRSMRGECTGKMRSTPTPYDVLRTVNVSRLAPPLRPMTVPSKTWMRSLSPSTTRTCTRTVSPGLKGGTSLRSCSASMRSMGFIGQEPFLLAVATHTVKDDGGSAADREVVPARHATDRLEHVVGASDHVLGEAPAGAEDEQLRSARLGQAPAQGGKGQTPATLACAGRDQAREHARLALDVRDHRVEVGGEPRQRERLLARVVVGRARPRVPVAHDALDQAAECRYRRCDVEGSHVVGAREAPEVVHVQVGDGGGHHGAVLVVDGVMEERQVEVTHRATRAGGGWRGPRR